MSNFIPWILPQQQQLQRARASQRFPHALLIHDAPGAGGEQLARFAAQAALCRRAEAPCGQCRDCLQVQSNQHPDLRWLAPLEDSKQIRIEQVRELCEELALTSHGGGASVAVIAPAEAMNANAANALLKTLEEPRAGVTLVLVSALPSLLPATIVSRCQRLQVRAPARAECIAWLRAERGAHDWDAVLDVLGCAPLQALALDPDEVGRLRQDTWATLEQGAAIAVTAERWAKVEAFELRLACIENWLTARIEADCRGQRQLPELRPSAHPQGPSCAMNSAIWLRLLDQVYELRRLRNTPINRALALEQLLWQVEGVLRPSVTH
jgi:DNA polymerase-3 subunit delta'